MTRPPFRSRWAVLGAFLASALLLSACGTISSGRKIDYRNTPTLPPLEVPPDLSSVPDQNAPSQAPGSGATAPATATTYSGYTGEQKTPAPAASPVLPQSPDVKLMRDGQTRYVVVNAAPAPVWEQVKEFLTRTGLVIGSQNPKTGLIETEWAENRALVGAGANVLSKMFRRLESTGTRDKYHVRLENGVAPGTTEIYLTHRGMQELEPGKDSTLTPGWTPRPSDPELEAEMLQRLVAHLADERSPDPDRAVASAPSAPAAAPPSPVSTRLTRNGTGAPLLTLEDGLDRAWRRVGLSLDRIGFTVEDRDRSKGIYYVRYIDPETKKEKGFFSRMFTKDDPAPPNQFQVQVKRTDNGSSVEVLDKEGAPAVSTTGERILSLLYEQLK